MIKYYTRACNFYYGEKAKKLIKKKVALPLCGNKNIAFDNLEIISRKKNKISYKLINILDVGKLEKKKKEKVKKDIKKIILKRKKFLKKCKFFETINYGNFKSYSR